MQELEKNEIQYSDNGAAMYKTTGSKLLDLNFDIPNLRRRAQKGENLWPELSRALKEDPIHTLKWLLYLRDIRGGIGERASFRELSYELIKHTDLDFITKADIPEYGRWDDLIDIYFKILDDETIKKAKKDYVLRHIKDYLYRQLDKDKTAIVESNGNCSISLLAKWMPSFNTKNKENLRRARELAGDMNRIAYTKMLSSLRRYLDIVEVKMSSNRWNEIDYEAVPSKANLLYKNSFLHHDEERRREYLSKLNKGETKINASAAFPHDISSKYDVDNYGMLYYYDTDALKDRLKVDPVIENMWKALEKPTDFKDTLVVRDGSGSMTCSVSDNSNITILDVADALSIYCSQYNDGIFKDKFVTFSAHPEIIDLSNYNTLLDKLKELHKHQDCSNTNIESVFNLVLKTAKKAHAAQEDLPKQILIISDMQFDSAICEYSKDMDTLFDVIRKKYQKAGYELPKLVFWNLNSYNKAPVPLQENSNGLVLMSGYSQSLLKMTYSTEIDPAKALFEVLDSDRYSIIDKLFPNKDELNKQLRFA